MKTDVDDPQWGHAPAHPPENSAAQAAADARSLGRGMLVNLLGAIPKVLYPILMVLVVRLYGKEVFGVYSLVEATVFLALYLVTFGLDKAILWWLPQQPATDERRGLRPVLIVVAGASLLVTSALLVAGPVVLRESQSPLYAGYLRIMGLALAPLALMQMLVHAALAKRSVGAQVVIREGVVSLSLVGAALALWYLGARGLGLALAFLLSNGIGCLLSAVWVGRLYRHSRWPAESPWPPRPILRFALPMGFTGLVASLMLRLDLYLVAIFTDAATVGVYAVVLQMGKAVRTAHVSFGNMVIGISSAIGARGDSARLRAGFSRAAVLMMLVLAPLAAFLVLFAPRIMPLFGPGFSVGAPAAAILCVAWAFEGVLGLHGQFLIGRGQSRLCLLNMTITLAIEATLLCVLLPRLGLDGAVVSVGLAALSQNLLQVIQARRLARIGLFGREVGVLFVTVVAAAVAAWLVWHMAKSGNDLAARVLAFASFLALFALRAWPYGVRGGHPPKVPG